MGNEIQIRPVNDLSLFGMQSMADMIVKADIMIKSGFLPKAYNKPEAVIMACTIGAELGFSPMQALNVINVIEGKPTLSVNACLALVQKSGGFVETLELSETACKIRVSRPGRPEHIEEFTLVDASRAGLTGKQNWVKMPKNMLYARAASNGIRRVYADVLSGLYTTEEMQDAAGQQLSEEPTRATQPRTRAPANSGRTVEKAVESAVVDAILDAEEVGQVPTEPALPVGNSDKSNGQPSGEINVESSEHIALVCAANAPYEPTAYDYGRKLALKLKERGVKLEDVGQALKERFERLTAGG
jgi:hypothetical protein